MTTDTTPAAQTLPAPVATYDPFVYLPMQRAFFMTGNFTSLPDTAAKLAVEQPGLANHINAIWSFLNWMKSSNAPLYDVISNTRPDLVDPATIVTSGALTVDKSKTFVTSPNAANAKLHGLGDYSTDVVLGDTVGTTSTDVSTSWGQQLLDLIKGTAPAYFQAKSQSDLMKINIARAEQGLAPIDSSGLAPTVNFGLSPGALQMGYIAVAGLVAVGLFAAFKKAK